MEVTEAIKHLLRDKRGLTFPLVIAITLALVLLFTGISEYLRLLIVAQGVRDAVQAAVISTIVENYDDVYQQSGRDTAAVTSHRLGNLRKALTTGIFMEGLTIFWGFLQTAIIMKNEH